MANYRLDVAYDGTRYSGWERKSNGVTIEEKLEDVLARMTGREAKVIGAGRTDAGVHALSMTASVRLETELSPQQIRDYMNRYLPEDIRVNGVSLAGDRFHARYNAKGKTYRYTCYVGETKPLFDRKYVTVLERRPDAERMRRAAALLTGTRDYRSFCTNAQKKKSTVRTVERIEIREEGDRLFIDFTGSGFLTNMVRIMTGTLLEVGYGEREPEEMTGILEALDRSAAGPTAPAKGLCLMSVDY